MLPDAPTALEDARRRMVKSQLRARGIADEDVLATMERVPRHRFVAPDQVDRAYADHPLQIGFGQTVSQPYMVARMTELCELTPEARVLEVGAGCGYQTAILCELAKHVAAVEIIPDLADRARARLTELGYTNFIVECRDGSRGWHDQAPFDAILVAAGAPTLPPLFLEQLAPDGRLVIPLGLRGEQRLACVHRAAEGFATRWDTPCRFVDLVGQYGWGGEGGR